MGDFWNGKRVFITGCTGFLGSWLTDELLRSGAEITGLVRDLIPASDFYRKGLDRRINVVSGELEDYALVERSINEYEIDTVFHLAAQTQVSVGNRSPLSTFEANIRGSWNVLEACRINAASVRRVIVASSDKAYGPQVKLPYTEETPLKGTHPYDVSKSCTDLISYTYFNTYRLPVTVTRCGNIFGSGDMNFNRLIPGTIRSVLKNEPIIIRSDGTMKRDYFYVKDAVSAYLTLAEQTDKPGIAGEAFNFSSGEQISVLDMTRLILKLLDCPEFPVNVLGEAKGEIQDQYLSNDKANKLLGWFPSYTLEQALRETIDACRQSFNA